MPTTPIDWRLLLLLLASSSGLACEAAQEPPAGPQGKGSTPSQPPSGDGSVIIDLDAGVDAGSLPYDCAIGVSTGGSDPLFGELAPGGPIPIGGTGQAGLTARLAFRCTPRSAGDAPLVMADAELILTNAYTGVIAPREPAPMPITFSCEGDVCDHVPQLIEISHVAKLPELEGLKVRADLRVLSGSGELLGQDRTHGVLTPL